jgi:mannan endo-1,4-beta-mannosidase
MRFRLTAAAATLAVGFGLLTAAPVPATAATTPILFGLTDKWKTQIETDDSQLNYRSGVVDVFMNWQNVSPTTGVRWLNWARSRGAAPMIALNPTTTPTLSQIAHGSQDGYLRPWAKAMAAWGHPILLRLFPEMNLSGHSYAPGTRGQTTTQFRYAWRHVYNLFHANGATNVKFVWNPYRLYGGKITYKSLWPGGSYVNWVALDAYNYDDATHKFSWPYDLFAPSVTRIRSFTTKPLLIAEIGCTQKSYKPTWISRAPAAMQRLGAKAMVWFNENMKHDWRLDSSSASLSSARTTVHASNVTYAGRWSLARIDRLVASGS